MEKLFGIKREYRAASYTLLSCIVGVILMRIISYYVPTGEGYGGELASNALFTLPTQLVFFFAVPFLIYTFYGKRTPRQTFEYSGYRNFKPYFLLCIPIGLGVFLLTIGISSAWMSLLRFTGYNMPSPSSEIPNQFNFGFFIADVLLTCAIPAMCEEFAMRGGLLTTAQKSFKTVGCVIICGVIFGLFHQNIKQVFYTSLFGAFAAFLTIKLKSIFPVMIVHFMNNFSSVFFDYASACEFPFFGDLYNFIDAVGTYKPWVLVLLFFGIIAVTVGLTVLLLYLKERDVMKRKVEVIKGAAFDATNKRVVLFGEENEERVKELEMEKEVYGKDYVDEKYKPDMSDLIIIIGVGAAALLVTIFTYVWGFFY